jgi:hypothetical protein
VDEPKRILIVDWSALLRLNAVLNYKKHQQHEH